MDRDPKEPMDEWGRDQTRGCYYYCEDNPRPVGLEGRVDSYDFKHIGGHFREAPETEAQYLDPSDLETHPEDADSDSSSPDFTRPLSTQSRHALVPNPQYYLREEPYLSQEEFNILMSNNERREQSRSSGQSSGEYMTAHGSLPSMTTVDDEGSGDLERTTTPYFTPSHTPSHRSSTTENDDEQDTSDPTIREPGSPAPFSNLYQHTLAHATGAIDAYDNSFTENQIRGHRGH